MKKFLPWVIMIMLVASMWIPTVWAGVVYELDTVMLKNDWPIYTSPPQSGTQIQGTVIMVFHRTSQTINGSSQAQITATLYVDNNVSDTQSVVMDIPDLFDTATVSMTIKHLRISVQPQQLVKVVVTVKNLSTGKVISASKVLYRKHNDNISTVLTLKHKRFIVGGRSIIEGVVTDDMGVPVPNFTVLIQDSSSNTLASTQTAADGSFAMSVVFPHEGQFYVVAGSTKKPIEVRYKISTNVSVVLKGKIVHITGSVWDASGGVEGVHVGLFTDSDSIVADLGMTNDKGVFSGTVTFTDPGIFHIGITDGFHDYSAIAVVEKEIHGLWDRDSLVAGLSYSQPIYVKVNMPNDVSLNYIVYRDGVPVMQGSATVNNGMLKLTVPPSQSTSTLSVILYGYVGGYFYATARDLNVIQPVGAPAVIQSPMFPLGVGIHTIAVHLPSGCLVNRWNIGPFAKIVKQVNNGSIYYLTVDVYGGESLSISADTACGVASVNIPVKGVAVSISPTIFTENQPTRISVNVTKDNQSYNDISVLLTATSACISHGGQTVDNISLSLGSDGKWHIDDIVFQCTHVYLIVRNNDTVLFRYPLHILPVGDIVLSITPTHALASAHVHLHVVATVHDKPLQNATLSIVSGESNAILYTGHIKNGVWDGTIGMAPGEYLVQVMSQQWGISMQEIDILPVSISVLGTPVFGVSTTLTITTSSPVDIDVGAEGVVFHAISWKHRHSVTHAKLNIIPFYKDASHHRILFTAKDGDVVVGNASVAVVCPQISVNVDRLMLADNFVKGNIITPSGAVVKTGTVVFMQGEKVIGRFNVQSFEKGIQLNISGEGDVSLVFGGCVLKRLPVIVDKQPPRLVGIVPASGATVSTSTVKVVLDAEDKGSYVHSISIGGDVVYTGTQSAVHITYVLKLKHGKNVFDIVLVDGLGNEEHVTYTLIYQPEIRHIKLYPGKRVYYIDGKKHMMDVAPFIDPRYGRTVVPIRFVAEALGYHVAWDGSTGVITITSADRQRVVKLIMGPPSERMKRRVKIYHPDLKKKVLVYEGTSLAYVNEQLVDLSNYKGQNLGIPFIYDGRTFVPLRFIVEAMQATVKWNPDERSIDISG